MEQQSASSSSSVATNTATGSTSGNHHNTTTYGTAATTFDLFGSRSRLFYSFFQASKKENLKIFLPSICHLFGVIIFMRLGEIVGTMGLFYTWFIITITFFITLFTIGSMSALLSTNIQCTTIRSGLLNRLQHSLGDSLSKFMGILFFFAFSIATSYYLLGFSEITLYYLAATNANTWTTISFASVLLGGLYLIFVCGLMTSISMRFLRLVFGLILISILLHIIFLLVPNDDSWTTGFSIQTLQQNRFLPKGHEVFFFHMLTSFFPAFCGIISGSNLADLTSQNISQKVLIIGVHQALLFGLLIYFILTFVLASCVESTILLQQVYIVQNIIDADLKIPIIYITITLTTLSSAFGNILNATHVFTNLIGSSTSSFSLSSSSSSLEFNEEMSSIEESVHLMPLSSAYSKEKNKNKKTMILVSPSFMVIGTTWFVSQCALLLYGQVDLILPFLSGIFLLIFSMINLTVLYQEFTFSSSMSSSHAPSYHPSFQMYSKWTALMGFLLSLSGFLYILACSNRLLMRVFFGFMMVLFILYHRHALLLMFSKCVCHTPTNHSAEWRGPHENDPNKQHHRIQLAALYIRDGFNGRFLGDKKYFLLQDKNNHHYHHHHQHPQQHIERTNVKRIFHALHYVRNGNLLVFCLLGFFEKPSWCFFTSSSMEKQGIFFFSIQVSMLIEIMCLFVLTGEMCMKIYFFGIKLYFVNKWHSIQMILVLIDFIFVFTSGAIAIAITTTTTTTTTTNTSISKSNPFHLSPMIRPLILISTSHRLRSAFYSLLKCMPRFLDGLLVLLVLIVLYGICGMILFENTQEGRLYFHTFQDACLNLLILLTTANFPDIMMPIFQEIRVSSVFFMSFLLIGLFYVMNVFFASIFQHYRHEIQKNTLKFQKNRLFAFQTAFELLLFPNQMDHHTTSTMDQMITRKTCQLLFLELSRPTMAIFDYQQQQLEQVYPSLFPSSSPSPSPSSHSHHHHWDFVKDKNKETMDGLTFDAFVQLLLKQNKKCPHGRHQQVVAYQKDFGSEWMNSCSKFIQSSSFEHWIDLIILLNLFMILIEIQAKIDHQIDQMVLIERFVMPVFSVIYLLEMMVKWFFYGSLKNYLTKQKKNFFDCIVTWIIFITEISIHLHYEEDEEKNFHWRLIRIILFLRFLRCLRLLVALKALNSMFDMLIRLIPAFTTLYGMLAIVMAEYAAIGMYLFGGKLRMEDPILANTTYGRSNYYANNFNDYASTLVTLFELLVVNNWYVIMEGVVAVTSKWSRLYFVSYYIIAVVMVLNLVIAFVVEAYLEQVTVEEEKDDICIGREERDKKSGGSREEQQEQNYDSLGRQDRNEHSIHLRQRNTSTSTTTDGGSNNEEDIFRRATSMPTIGIEEVL